MPDHNWSAPVEFVPNLVDSDPILTNRIRPHSTKSRQTSARAQPKLNDSDRATPPGYATLLNQRQDDRRSDSPSCSIPGRVWSKGPTLAEFGRCRAKFGRIRAQIGRSRPTLVDSAHIWAATFGRSRAESVRNRSNSAQDAGPKWPMLVELNLSQSQPQKRSRPHFRRVRPGLGQIWTLSTGPGPIWANICLYFEISRDPRPERLSTYVA